MKKVRPVFLAIWIAALLMAECRPLPAQEELPEIPSFLNESSNNSLMDLLKTDLLRRYRSARENQSPGKSGRIQRPSPELGPKNRPAPIDLSEYIGPEGDAEKTYRKALDSGAMPPPASAPIPEEATRGEKDLWSDLTVDQRFTYAEDLFKRRKYENAQRELEEILKRGLEGDLLLRALVMREQCLFHQKYYGIVQDDYYRLKSYYPDAPQIDALRQYLENLAGLTPLMNEAIQHPDNTETQRKLLDRFGFYGWYDFAEEFFIRTIQDTSPPTIKSLSEVYYKKEDHAMLIQLSRAARDLYPDEMEFVYNEAVGLYQLGDLDSRIKAKELFQEVYYKSKRPSLRNNADWYLQRLTPRSRF